MKTRKTTKTKHIHKKIAFLKVEPIKGKSDERAAKVVRWMCIKDGWWVCKCGAMGEAAAKLVDESAARFFAPIKVKP